MSRARGSSAQELRPLRLGLIGCGWVAERFHLPALATLPEIEVAALADVDPSRLDRLADDFRVPDRYPDASALIAAEVDAVGVCLPPESQARVGAEVLRSGRHLMIEKPVALSLEEIDHVIAERASTQVAVVGLNLRWHPFARRARHLLRTGGLGRLRSVRTRFFSRPPDREAEERGNPAGSTPHWRRSPNRGGDTLLDLGIHHFDLLRFLLGAEFEEVSAERSADRRSATVEARLSSGVCATVAVGESEQDINALEAVGDAGSLSISFYRRFGWRARGVRSGGIETLDSLARGAASFLAHRRRGGPYAASYRGQWRGFARAIRGGLKPEATLEDGRSALEVALAAIESARSGRLVEFAPERGQIRRAEAP